MKSFFPTPLLLSLLFCVSLSAQSSMNGVLKTKPEQYGLSSEKLESIRSFLRQNVQEGHIPGGVFIISRKGEILLHEAVGYRTPEKSRPYRKDDIFRIASMTKAFTTVAVLQLYEQGLLGLDEPLHRFIPAFKNTAVLDSYNEADTTFTTVSTERPITIRHLLTHTSGITYASFNPGRIRAIYTKYGMNNVGLSHDKWSNEQMVDQLAEAPLIFQPGSRYMYGLNMEVLGRVIEVVSGLSLSKYFQQHFFEPLGMKDTYFYLPAEKHQRLVPIYTYDKNGDWTLIPKENNDYPTAPDRPHYAGGGGLSSTAIDYARFIIALEKNRSGEGYRLLGRKTMEMMTSDQLIRVNEEGQGFSKMPGRTYGLGFELLTEAANGLNSKSPGTFQWDGYFNTKYFIDPQEDLTFVGMTQVLPFQYQQFWDRLYAMVYSTIED